jgi:hypothetical protein
MTHGMGHFVPIREIAAARTILFDFQNLHVCLAMTDRIGTVIANRRQKRQAIKELPAMWQSPEKKLEPEAIVTAPISQPKPAITSLSEDCRGLSAIPIAIGTRNSSQ